MKILVCNAGSSSLKYQLVDMDNDSVMAKGVCGRIGAGGEIKHETSDGRKYEADWYFPTHTEAFEKVMALLTKGEYSVIESLDEISAVGHRTVQGAEYFSASVLITQDVIDKIESVSDLAPLHNPASVLAIKACQKILNPKTPHVAVFDTAFHHTMPEKAYMYALPYDFYKKYNVRKYGFHGTSHRCVSARMAEILGRDIKDIKMVTCHLGNGSSITAVDGGRSIDTSMGFTPLDGMIMGTRSGSVDPSVVLYIMEKEGLSESQMNELLNKQSGCLGLSQLTSDQRDLVQAAAEGHSKAQLVLDMQAYQIKKYIGSYAAAMGGLDAVVFTGGIGENSFKLRERACEGLSWMGIDFDPVRNEERNRREAEISAEGSRVKVWIVPTNEEGLIARDTLEVISKL